MSKSASTGASAGGASSAKAAGGGDGGASAAPPRPITLPSLPRCDEANRAKWAAEYDRIEAELLRPHLAGTMTLGLRQLPASWDRTVPPPGVDLDTNAARGARRAKSTIPSSLSLSAAATGGGYHGSGTSPTATNRSSDMVHRGLPVRPQSARVASSSRVVSAPLSSTPMPPLTDANALLRVLFTLVDTPLKFRLSLPLDVRHIDLHWLATYNTGGRVPPLNTLETVRDDAYQSRGKTGGIPPLNSPRSVLVLLRNGVSVDDLQVRPIDMFTSPGTPLEEAELHWKHHEDRRVSLLNTLRDEYRTLCAKLTLYDLIEEIPSYRRRQQLLHDDAAIVGGSAAARDAAAAAASSPRRAAAAADRKGGPSRTSSPNRPQQQEAELEERRLQQLRAMDEQQHQREIAAEQRRAAAEAELRARAQSRTDALIRAERNRAAAREKARALEEQSRAAADARAQKAAERLEAFAALKSSRALEASRIERERRALLMEASRRAEERRAQDAQRIRTRQEVEAAKQAQRSEARAVQARLSRLQHQVEQDDKSFLLGRQKKADLYSRLLLAADLENKRVRAESVARSPLSSPTAYRRH